MVSAVVVTDFTVNGVTYRNGQKITISETQYFEWLAKNWVAQIVEPVETDWCPPTSDNS